MPSSNNRRQPGPPRLLLGISLLFWGGMIGHPLIGLLMAVAAEAAHWTRVRWEFGEHAFYRAWQASVLLVFFAGVIVWMDSSVFSALPRTLIWLPVLFFPLQFAQSYGIHRTMPLATFSLFVRKRREHARKHGLPFRDVQVAFGHVYFTVIIIAASLGTFAKTPIYFPCLIILIAWAFWRQFSWTNRLAPLSAMLILGIAVAGGYGGDKILDMIYHRMIGIDSSANDFARQTSTAIGSMKEIKQSPNILWRLKSVEGSLPRRIRVASYNKYTNTRWRADLLNESQGDQMSMDFKELGSIGVEDPFRIIGRGDNSEFITGEEASSSHLPRFTLTGALKRHDLLPIPTNAASVIIPAQNLEINPLGSLRIDPKHPVANATMLWKREMNTSSAPWLARSPKGFRCPDLDIPRHEQEVITEVADELNLREGNLEEKITRIRNHFIEHFTYTRYLDRPYPKSNLENDQFIGIFLQDSRRGHCEYFASATAMLLREVGIPTRYVTGFAIVEINPKSGEALVRGTHAHAWCEAWDANRETWIEVDLTPPDWTSMEAPRMPPWQNLLDRWHMLRDDLLVWRSHPGNLAIAIAIIFTPFAFGAILIGRRLWKSKHRVDPTVERRAAHAAHPTTPLSGLEKLAARHLGPRPPGTPLGSWFMGLASKIPQPERLTEAVTIHREIRFDPTTDAEALTKRLAALADLLRKDLKS
ncbi:transglutaminase-like domain-containing protein [Haloferula sp.]|uniref:transglutaminase-like domain-containing protein n=1 Tax=Haloferula sp. TaxID=2497595 RepID=UPI003C75D1AF